MQQQSKKVIWIYALIVFFAAVLVYRFSVTVTFSGDDLQYTTVIESALTGERFYHPTGGLPYPYESANLPRATLPINPRYLFEWPTSFVAAQLWDAAGWQDNVIAPIQTVRILVGALGLVAFFLAVHTLVQHIPISLLVTTGLGLTVSYWTYSIHMDQSINMVTALCFAFYVFARQTRTGFTRSGILILILILALASFYNFTAAVSTVAFAVGVGIFSGNLSLSTRFVRFVIFGVVYVFVVAAIIAGSIAIFISPASVVDPAFWRAATFGGKPEYLISPVSDAIRGAIGLGKSQVLFPGVYGSLNDFFDTASTANRAMLLAYYGVVLVLMALPFLFVALRRKQLGAKAKVALFLTVWLLAHTLFNWFWDPGFNKYWLIPLVCCWAVAALALDHIRTVIVRNYRPAFIAVSAFIIVCTVINITTQFLPDSRKENNPWLTIASSMNTESQPQDLFLSPGHAMDFYMTYFGHRDLLSATLIAYDSGENMEIVQSKFSERIADHLADNGKIYVYGLEALTEEQKTAFEALIADGTLTEKWTYPTTTIYEWVSS